MPNGESADRMAWLLLQAPAEGVCFANRIDISERPPLPQPGRDLQKELTLCTYHVAHARGIGAPRTERGNRVGR